MNDLTDEQLAGLVHLLKMRGILHDNVVSQLLSEVERLREQAKSDEVSTSEMIDKTHAIGRNAGLEAAVKVVKDERAIYYLTKEKVTAAIRALKQEQP